MKNGTDYVIAKLDLIEQAAADERLSAIDLRVHLLLITRYLNGQTGQAWPGPARLASDLGVSARSIRRSLKRLCGTGWWRQAEKGGGIGRTSRYEPCWETVTAMSPFEAQTVTPVSANSDISRHQTVTPVSPKPFEDNPLREPIGYFDQFFATDSQPAPVGEPNGNGVACGAAVIARQGEQVARKSPAEAPAEYVSGDRFAEIKSLLASAGQSVN